MTDDLIERLRAYAREGVSAALRPDRTSLAAEAAQALSSSQARVNELEGVLERIADENDPPEYRGKPLDVRVSLALSDRVELARSTLDKT